MRFPCRIREVAIGIVALMSAGAGRTHAAPQTPPSCKNFGLVTEWKGTLSIVGTGSGTLSDGGTYSINESITASPDLASGGAFSWSGNFNETIHIDDMESHPDGTFTHVTDDETIPGGPITAALGLPGAGLTLDLTQCTFQLNFDPSFHGTITTEQGTQTGTPSYAWVGLQPSGSLFLGPGDFQGPLPTSGLAIPGSASISYFSEVIGDPATWAVNWSLNPVLDLDLLITIPQYSTWRPTAGLTELDTGLDDSGQPNLLTIQALLVKKSTQQPVDFPPDNVTFLLQSPSHQPGVSMNWPPKNQLISPPPSDLSFDKNQSANANFQINSDGTQAQIVPTTSPLIAPVTIVLSPHDWGGWAALNVTATAAGQTIEGHFSGDPSNYILLPRRQPGLYTADVWKDAHSVALSTSDVDDSEEAPVSRVGCTGDGLTLYEEYRGFMENGKHIEGDPHNKDFFIENLIGADAEPGIFLFTDLTGLTVHKDLKKNETLIDHANGTLGSILINFNHLDNDPTHVTDQHGVTLISSLHAPGSTYFSMDGGATILSVANVHGKPGITDGIAMQLRDAPGTLNPTDTHNGSISAIDAFLQYDIGVAHELLHSVGVDHHGDDDLGQQFFKFYMPNSPRNPSDQPVVQWVVSQSLAGQNLKTVRILAEDGTDFATAFLQQGLPRFKLICTIIPSFLLNPYGKLICQAYDELFNKGLSMFPYVGNTHGQHSGNDQCVMRYFLATLYPSITDSSIFYVPKSGTEPVGSSLCPSPAGTGVNDPAHKPQSRYGTAAMEAASSIGRGTCQKWICVSDAYPPVSDVLSTQQ